MTPTPAAIAAAKRFLEIEEMHNVTHKGRWAMFAAALTKHKVDEWEVEDALEWLEDEAAMLEL